MNAKINTEKISRPLYEWEIDMAAPVFGKALQYHKVRIHEFALWPDRIDDIGRKLKKIAAREPGVHNAITLFNHCNFPVGLPIQRPKPTDSEYYKTGWLMHELTHCWQFQKIGAGYIFLAVQAQFRQGANVYDFGGPSNLVARHQSGFKFTDFNLEQQGNICQSFYLAMENLPVQQEMYNACLPYIHEIQANVS